MECMACGIGNLPEHYLKDGVCPDCRTQERLLRAIERAEKAEAEVERLKEENEYINGINHSVSVCPDHTREITTFGGCLVCEVERLKAEVRNAYLEGFEDGSGGASNYYQGGDCSDAQTMWLESNIRKEVEEES